MKNFERVFPFHLTVDPELCVCRFGQVLGRVLPDLRERDALTTHFDLVRPRFDQLRFAELRDHPNSVILLRAKAKPLALRGQFICDDEESTVTFLGSPWVTSPEQLDALGLSVSDFAVHDPLADMLVLLHTQQRSLEDAQALATKLREQRSELERTSAALAAKLGEIEAQRDLIRTLSTPVITVWDEVVVLPLIGALDEQRAERFMTTVLDAVAHDRARHVIIDVTGATQFGPDIVRSLQRTAGAIGLLGARCVVVGISPKLASELVASNAKLENIATFSTLQTGLRDALTRSVRSNPTAG